MIRGGRGVAWSALAWCFVIRLEEWGGCVFRGGFIQVVFVVGVLAMMGTENKTSSLYVGMGTVAC